MKQGMRQQLSQSLSLTPQLLQSIRLLHLNAIELETEVNRALEENPLLEADVDEDSADETAEASEVELEDMMDGPREDLPGDFIEAGMSRVASGNDDDDPLARCIARDTGGIRQRLLEQLSMELRTPEELEVAAWLIDQVDDAGYLELSLEALSAAALARGIDPLRLAGIRHKLMRLEPSGYGAIDLRECLRVQLEQRPSDEPGHALALRIVTEHLDLMAEHDHNAIADALEVSADEVICAERLIMALDPKPGTYSAPEPQQYVVPDVIVRKGRNGNWVVSLNPLTAPKVRISPVCEALLEGAASDDAGAKKMRELLQDARWLTRGLSMRYDTLLKTTQAIVERQLGFFDRGEEGMCPLTLREIADAIGMHESSISRITTGKYVQTPRGTFELKYFFAVRLEGASVAGVAVRAMVKRLIDSENPIAPLADDTIVSLLARQGVSIARRTVAKYREMLHIASAKERRLIASSPQRLARVSHLQRTAL
ncbi:RNA polymerase factor sigma-54 [Aquimonas sp.]|jgi:RNA polymerase sigma-54 factor|uniref:RNA polymerase factor sigma-54 n=1 Tax=Aquimonas sp. TaxID=1872588 RepID=UPI0037BFC400